MAHIKVAGTQYAIASTYGASVNMTVLSNAAEAVATLAASHGVVVGDILEVTSGWDHLNGRLVRISAVATNDVTFEDINTTDTDKYPAGAGTGSIRRITAWTNFAQVKAAAPSGGETNFTDATSMSDTTRKQIPIDRNATSLNLTVFDDTSLSYYAVVKAAHDANAPTGLRVVRVNGSRILHNGYFSVGEPRPGEGLWETDISFAGVAESTRYAD